MSSWSRLRKELRSYIIPELRSSIDLHYTRYEGGDPHNAKFRDRKNWRLWVTLDSVEIYSFDFWDFAAQNGFPHLRRGTSGYMGYVEGCSKTFDKEFRKFNSIDTIYELKKYLNSTVSDALNSPSPIVRAWYWLDRRIGKRTVLKAKLDEDEHELVRRFYELRLALMRDSVA